MRKTIGRLLGYGWTERLGPGALGGLVFALLAAAMLAAACGASVWPVRDDPERRPAGCPSVVREGERLRFEPAAAYVGEAAGEESALGRSALVIAPDGRPTTRPAGALILTPDSVEMIDRRGEARRASPAAYEAVRRGVAAFAVALAFFAAAPLFLVATRLLIAARFAPRTPRPSALRIVLRAFVPALLAAAAAALVRPVDRPPFASFAALFAVAGANLLFGVADGARTASRTSPPFGS
jgi:hypothetical protein